EILPTTNRTTPPAGATYASMPVKGEVEDGQSLVIPIPILVTTLERAYAHPYQRARLDVEFHWREHAPGGRSSFEVDYYSKRSFGFYIFRPLEVLNATRSLPTGEITTAADSETNRKFWLPVFEKTFTGADKSPVKLTSSVTYSATRMDSTGIQITQRK